MRNDGPKRHGTAIDRTGEGFPHLGLGLLAAAVVCVRLGMSPDASTEDESPPARIWQQAKANAAELGLDLPTPAEGTHVYIVADRVAHHTLVLLRASVRAIERAGVKVKLL